MTETVLRVKYREDVAAGRAARDAALDLFDTKAEHVRVIRECRQAMIALYQNRQQFESPAFVNGDDASRFLDDMNYQGNRKVIGAVFRPKSGWRSVGSTPSTLKRRHGRAITCWQWIGV